jgi:two-component system response regulator RegX3
MSTVPGTRVLIVEDEQAYRETLQYMLTSAGYDVSTAADGFEALDKFRRNGADLVLLDLMLPRLSGIEVFNRIRAASSVPIIMVTAKSDEDERVAGLEIGADDYVTKPFSGRELLARIAAVLRRSSMEFDFDDDTELLSERGITLNPERLTMEKDGHVVSLPPKEFALLHELMSARGRVLTRDKIIARVWGSDYVGDTKTLDVHIKRLRSRVEDDPSNPQIIGTVRGVGYVFEVK